MLIRRRKGDYLGQAERGRVHVAVGRYVPDVVEASDIFRFELRVIHRLPDASNEVGESVFFARLVGEAVDVDHGQLNLALFVPPNRLIRIAKGPNEAIQKLHSVHGQVH